MTVKSDNIKLHARSYPEHDTIQHDILRMTWSYFRICETGSFEVVDDAKGCKAVVCWPFLNLVLIATSPKLSPF